MDSVRTPVSARTPSLGNVPEEGGTFAIGDDDESEDERSSRATPAASSRQSKEGSRTSSIAESMEDAVPSQLGGMSQKARGKMPASSNSFSRVTSNASLSSISTTNIVTGGGRFDPSVGWIDSWLNELPLHTTLMVIDQLLPRLPHQGASGTTSAVLKAIRESPNPISDVDRSPVRVHLFEWSPLSLGWYESLLWSFIFTTEMTITKGAPGVWKGTHIRLFRVQETAKEGPTLMQPTGAVDAVGNSLVKKIGSLNLGQGLTGTRRPSGGVVRDV